MAVTLPTLPVDAVETDSTAFSAPPHFASSSFRPRVLFVSSSVGNGGADRHAVSLAGGLRARGVEVVFACQGGEFTDRLCRDSGVPTAQFGVTNSGDLTAAVQLAKLIVDHSIDVVHAHARRDFVTAALGKLLARRRRARVVFHVHLIRTLGGPPRLAGRFFQSRIDNVIAVSDSVATFLNQRHGLRDGFVRTIHNGVELDNYAAPGTAPAQTWQAEIRRDWGVPDDALVIGMIGRLFQKGQAGLLAVAERLVRQFPKLYIVFAGPIRDPGDRERLLYWAERQNVGGRVIVTGICENIPAVMASFDILAHLPTDEAFGLVLVEAMASGIPVVATAIGGCREVVVEGKNGLLVPPREHGPLIAALSTLLDPDHGEARRAAMGAEGLRTAQGFSRDRQLDQLQALYIEMCGRGARNKHG